MSLTLGDDVGLRPAVSPVATGVDLDSPPQVSPIKVGPQPIQEHHFGVGRLPHQEVRGALLAGGTDEKVDIRDVGFVQEATEAFLCKAFGIELTALDRKSVV